MGSVDNPVNPLMLALGVGGTFVARSIDIDLKHLEQVMVRASNHRGTTFTEVYQDCNIYNHQSWFYASQKDTRPEHTVMLEHGKPLIFGTDRNKGIRLRGTHLEVVKLGDGVTEKDLLVHDETNLPIAFALAQMAHPEFPEPLGVLYANPNRKAYDDLVHEQVEGIIRERGEGDLEALLSEGDTWMVEE
jgi:2-oxoglutarate ferredoxin oxidoreductase subunit beta